MPDVNIDPAIFGQLPGETQMQIAATCNSQGCKDAKIALITARNNVLTACTDVDRFSADRTFFAAIAGALWLAAATAAGAGAAAPWPVNLVLLIIAAALAVVAIVMTAFAVDATNKVAAAKAVLAAQQQKFKDAATAVTQKCDPFCFP